MPVALLYLLHVIENELIELLTALKVGITPPLLLTFYISDRGTAGL